MGPAAKMLGACWRSVSSLKAVALKFVVVSFMVLFPVPPSGVNRSALQLKGSPARREAAPEVWPGRFPLPQSTVGQCREKPGLKETAPSRHDDGIPKSQLLYPRSFMHQTAFRSQLLRPETEWSFGDT